MKTIKTIFLALTAMVALSVATPSVSADTVTPEQKKMVIETISSQLPVEATPGMMWTKITLNPAGTLLTLTFDMDPSKIGVTLDEMKKEINNLSPADQKNAFGEMMEISKMLDCSLDLVLVFPDKTSKTFHFDK